MSAEFWITTIAIVLGPLSAVLVTHLLQQRKETWQSRMHVFRGLMTTRKAPLSAEQVQALNLVEVEFSDQPKVMKSFEDLLKVYNDTARWKSEDDEVRRGVVQEADDRTVDLMNAIGKVLGYRLEKLDLLRGGYYPQAFSIVENQQQEIRELFAGLNNGSKVLPVFVVEPRNQLPQAEENVPMMLGRSKSEKEVK